MNVGGLVCLARRPPSLLTGCSRLEVVDGVAEARLHHPQSKSWRIKGSEHFSKLLCLACLLHVGRRSIQSSLIQISVQLHRKKWLFSLQLNLLIRLLSWNCFRSPLSTLKCVDSHFVTTSDASHQWGNTYKWLINHRTRWHEEPRLKFWIMSFDLRYKE